MKRYVRSSRQDSEKKRLDEFREVMTVPRTKHRYAVKGAIDEYAGVFFASISRIAPYDDADYWWARVNGSGLIEFIKDSRVQQTYEFKEFDEDTYELVADYMNEMIDEALKQVDRLNDSIKPVIIHN